MDLALIVAAALAAAALLAALVRAQGRRQLAESQAATSAEIAALKRDNAWLAGEVERQTTALGATQALLDKTEARLRDAFQSAAAEALRDNRSAFLDLAKTSFAAFHQPIADTLRKVDQRLGETERDRIAAYSRLTEQIAALGATTHTLSRALRSPAVRGRWGEMQLRRVVEIAGMVQRCDFDEQPALATDNGRLRPDLVVHLPGARRIVVDAKAPLEAFLDAQEASDEETRAGRLQAHARQVREHMDRLGAKAYWEALGDSPDMVVMFLPGETLFSAALQQDLTLIEHGLRQRVLLSSPITLIALLTTVAHTWRQESLAENYREVARLGQEFYERLVTFADHLDEVRKKLDGAVQAYNQAAGSFEARVLVSARRLRELDAARADDIPATGSIETVPRVLRQAGLMGLPDEATAGDSEIT